MLPTTSRTSHRPTVASERSLYPVKCRHISDSEDISSLLEAKRILFKRIADPMLFLGKLPFWAEYQFTVLEDLSDGLQRGRLEHVGGACPEQNRAARQAREVSGGRGEGALRGGVIREQLVGLEIGAVQGEAAGHGRAARHLHHRERPLAGLAVADIEN